MTRIHWHAPTQVLAAIGFLELRSRIQAPNIRGLRPELHDVSPRWNSRIQAPNIRGLRRLDGLFKGSQIVVSKPSPENQGIETGLMPFSISPWSKPSPENQGIKTRNWIPFKHFIMSKTKPREKGDFDYVCMYWWMICWERQNHDPKIRGLRLGIF